MKSGTSKTSPKKPAGKRPAAPKVFKPTDGVENNAIPEGTIDNTIIENPQAPVKGGSGIEEGLPKPKGVLSDITQLDRMVTAAKNNNVTRLLVTPEILEDILKENYKNDAYMIYYDVELHDYNKVGDTERKNAETLEQKIFGNSKVIINDVGMKTAPKAIK